MSTETTPAPVPYTPPASEGGADPGVDLNAIIAKFQPQIAEVAKAAPAAIIAGGPASPAPEAPAAPAADAQTPAPVEHLDQPPLRAKQLAALARMEAEARALKDEYEAKLKSLEKPADKPVASSIEELRRLALIDPEAAVKALGIDDPSGFASQLFYGSLGEDAPPELKKEIADRRRDAELAALKQQIAKQQEDAREQLTRAQREAQVVATDRELSQFAKTVPPELTFLADQARSEPDAVYEGLCTIAASFIQAGRFPSARECAELFEQQLSADYERLSRAKASRTPPAPPAPATAPAPQTPPSPTGTLTDADTRGRAVVTTPADPESPDAFLDKARAIAEAAGYRWR